MFILFPAGVDACNTALGVIIFAGVTNLGQTWATILSLFGGTPILPSKITLSEY